MTLRQGFSTFTTSPLLLLAWWPTTMTTTTTHTRWPSFRSPPWDARRAHESRALHGEKKRHQRVPLAGVIWRLYVPSTATRRTRGRLALYPPRRLAVALVWRLALWRVDVSIARSRHNQSPTGTLNPLDRKSESDENLWSYWLDLDILYTIIGRYTVHYKKEKKKTENEKKEKEKNEIR